MVIRKAVIPKSFLLASFAAGCAGTSFVAPTQSATYTLYATSVFGRITAILYITVQY